MRDYSRITQQLLKTIDVLVDVLDDVLVKRKRKKQAKAKNKSLKYKGLKRVRKF